MSHPTMGAWIEISYLLASFLESNVSHPTMGAWIEISNWCYIVVWVAGRTPRWVRGLKFAFFAILKFKFSVAPHDGCVDWNYSVLFSAFYAFCRTPRWVRGLKYLIMLFFLVLADRRTPRWVRGLKLMLRHVLPSQIASHPTMGAWIEICRISSSIYIDSVAPHDGCVDWNCIVLFVGTCMHWSHPTMGAWIEILLL